MKLEKLYSKKHALHTYIQIKIECAPKNVFLSECCAYELGITGQ